MTDTQYKDSEIARGAGRSVVGTWRLVMTRAKNDSGAPMDPRYGPKAMGLVVFAADGRMMAVLCDGLPAMPESEAREYMSYCGNYRFDGTTRLYPRR